VLKINQSIATIKLRSLSSLVLAFGITECAAQHPERASRGYYVGVEEGYANAMAEYDANNWRSSAGARGDGKHQVEKSKSTH
tara:strand:+ start:323 stop:568 length:246 start_codon:yes stop_codon:yes gene_type:complete